MTLLGHYLQSVGMFLPKGVPRDDVLAEIAEHLRSTIEEREVRLGRRLTEIEQERILNDYGSPMMVAGRYGNSDRRLAFSGVLIGPEIFPLYLRVLALNWCIAIAIHTVLNFVIDKPAGWSPFLTTVGCQFVGLTVIFSIIDRWQRRSKQKWYFPPVYLQPIPRWQSASGLVVWTVMTIVWAAVPMVPSLVLGEAAAAGSLRLAPGWSALYWPLLAALLLGLAQRAINLVRPDWNWLLPALRLAANVLPLALLYFMQSRYPYIVVADPANTPADVARGVTGLNDLIWWVLVGVSPFYFLTLGAINAWLCAQHVRYVLRRHREAAA
ncbi:MAG TPA: hypothetical protein VFS23_02915 [Vicinamibacterales bacterium]|nr:hypothetical protein [Vicinamibacterales bacterium]